MKLINLTKITIGIFFSHVHVHQYINYADLKTDVSIGDSMICSDIWHKYH